MASGRINRNVYLCTWFPVQRGCWRVLTRCQHTIAWSDMVSSAPSDLDDTERPWLTSDFLLRRSAGGEILIFADLIVPFDG